MSGNRHVLVTGGGGFIGSHVCRALLAAGHRVRILDDLSTARPGGVSPECEFVAGSVTDAALVQRAMADVDGCIHLAAVASVARANEAWSQTHEINLGGTVRVLEAARATPRRPAVPVVYASSAAIYGDARELPIDEGAAPRPLSAYGADKLGCELHARVASEVHGVPTVGLRLFNVYGPGQRADSMYAGAISTFASKLQAGETVTVLGDGGQFRDFLYVADAVRFFLAALERPAGTAAVFNACTGRPTTINGLVATLAALAGRKTTIAREAARSGDIYASLGDPRAAATHLGVRATTPLGDGLRRTLEAAGTCAAATLSSSGTKPAQVAA